MTGLRSIVSRLKAMFSRQELDERIDEELRFHIEMQTEENMRRGMPEEEARRQALIETGGLSHRDADRREHAPRNAGGRSASAGLD